MLEGGDTWYGRGKSQGTPPLHEIPWYVINLISYHSLICICRSALPARIAESMKGSCIPLRGRDCSTLPPFLCTAACRYLARVISRGRSPVGSTSLANTSLLISIMRTCSRTPCKASWILDWSVADQGMFVCLMPA